MSANAHTTIVGETPNDRGSSPIGWHVTSLTLPGPGHAGVYYPSSLLYS